MVPHEAPLKSIALYMKYFLSVSFATDSFASTPTCSTRRDDNSQSYERDNSTMNSSAEIVDQSKGPSADLDLSDVSEDTMNIEDPDLEQAFVRVDSTG